MNSCNVCAAQTKNKCSNCNQVSYCSVQHQKQDWRQHKANCHPFKIAENELLGRHLIATRNIKPYEIILKEAPLVRGPAQISAPVCLGCLNSIEPTDYIKCEMCGWPLCGKECKSLDEHKAECRLTQGRGQKVNVEEFNGPHPLYTCVTTVRCLLIGETSPANAEKFQQLESLEDTRRGSNQWKADLASIGHFIPKFFKTSRFSEEEIMRAIGTLQVNGHEIPTSDPPHVAVFYVASFTENSCLPNLAKSFNKNGHCILWAPKAIQKNEHLSICYSDALLPRPSRQHHLKQTKLFKCACVRCQDITDLGTYYSAIKCEDSQCVGLMLPTKLEDWNGTWSCGSCKKIVQKSYLDRILERASKDIQNMDKSVDNAIKFLNHYEKWLPSQHFHMSEVKMLLVQLIAKDVQALMVVPDDKLNLKIIYARELIDLYEKITPCEVRMLGMLCFELHSAIAESTRRISLQTSLSPRELLEESLLYVDKCVNYLQYESDIFIEGHILKQAKINRDALRMVMRIS
ncbi:SET domain-containing protein SmydA-8 [Scaptodrosophila lebanonensis]|uniref:SET domain-containing protein SmydA-8 n=1 Tax=Drosophila lebanonensis TaxID=7225 RepID=A0A6J2UJJ7_DROLE|nr:SET domain-containing protein SmydA-8 [Scaptodrosophila lebanonensis]